MTAGRGITHCERFEKARAQGDMCTASRPGSRCRAKTRRPIRHSRITLVPTCRMERGGVRGRLIAGSAFGMTALRERIRRCSTSTRHRPGAEWRSRPNIPSARFMWRRRGRNGGARHDAGQMLVFGGGASHGRSAERSTVMLLGGEPVGERFLDWNFVSSSKDRMAQASPTGAPAA